MKILIMLLATLCFANSTEIADGSGFFPVLVQVMKADGVTPAVGMSVKLTGLPIHKETEIDSAKQQNSLSASLGIPVMTDQKGCAVVFQYSKWSEVRAGDKSQYTRPLHGTLVIGKGNDEVHRIRLDAWAKQNGYTAQAHDAPVVIVTLK